MAHGPVDVSAALRAVVVDFGGVLTTSVGSALAVLGAGIGADPMLPARLLSRDEQSSRLLVEHEEGRLSQRGFEEGFAERLRAHGAEATADGLVATIQAALQPDRAMLDLIRELRASGVPVGLLSNSLGDDCYAGFDLPALFDAVVISAEIGARKPSSRAYGAACDALGVAPEEAVMVDDLEHNIVAARRFGMAGVVHTSAAVTAAALAGLGIRVPAQSA